MESEPALDAGDITMRARVGGQKQVMGLAQLIEAQGERSRSDRFFARHVFSDIRAYGVFWHAMARKSVADCLMELGPEWTVFHDVPVRGSKDAIAHLVVGPGGVLALTTWPAFGQDVWVGGRTMRVGKVDSPILPSVEESATLAEEALRSATGVNVNCAAVLVLVDTGSVEVPITPVAVKLINRDHLLAWLRDRPVVLDEAAVRLITAAAERPQTWSDDLIEHVDPGAVLDVYSSILLQLESRSKVRGRWKVARRVGGWLLFLALAAAAIPVMLAFMPS